MAAERTRRLSSAAFIAALALGMVGLFAALPESQPILLILAATMGVTSLLLLNTATDEPRDAEKKKWALLVIAGALLIGTVLLVAL